MATIRITKDLMRDIERKIDADVRPINDKHAASFKIGMSAEDIYEHALTAFLAAEGVERATFDGLPQSWKDDCQNITLSKVNGVNVPWNYRNYTFANPPVYAPDRMKCDMNVEVECEALQPIADAVVAWVEEEKRLHAEQAAFLSGVKKIMNACSTVKQAVEMWPQFIEVLPDNVKSRHFEVEVRQKKAKLEIDGDLTDALSGHLVSTKISKAL